jgi:competence protein ComEA
MRIRGLLLFAILFPIAALAASVVNINTADVGTLDTLPGIGPSKAAAIVDYRTTHGPFARAEDIQNVKGIGPTTFANMKDLITVAASTTAPQPAVQPSPVQTSYDKQATPPATQKPITSPKNFQSHAEAIDAPAVANDLATVGAPILSKPVTHPSRASGLFSVWTFGLFGVILVAGGAFILI